MLRLLFLCNEIGKAATHNFGAARVILSFLLITAIHYLEGVLTWLIRVLIAKNGMRMTIIAFRKYNDIDVQFDDGTVREHIRYEHFLSGDVINKNVGGAKSIKTREQVLGV